MVQPIPTVDDLLTRTHLGGHFHEWNIDAAVIRVTRDELRKALEDAYDPTMPNWPAMVEIDNAPSAKDCVFQFERRECIYYTGGRKPKKRRKVVLAPGEGRYFDEGVQLRWMAWQACWEYLTGASLSDA